MKINRKVKIAVVSIFIFHLGYEAANNDLFPLTHFYDRHFGVEPVPEPVPVVAPVQIKYSVYSDISQKQRVDCPERDQTFVVAMFGQSNAANAAGHRNDNQDARIVNFFNGFCYIAKDPLLGATGFRGSVWIPFLRELDTDKTILAVNFAVGSSSILQWLDPEGLGALYSENMLALTDSGYAPDLFMWVQGEAELFSDEKEFETRLRALVDQIEEGYPEAKIGISSTTYCTEQRSNALIAGVQRKVALFRQLIWLGNTDKFNGLEYRYDGCHLSGKAVDEVAAMFAEAVNKYLPNTE